MQRRYRISNEPTELDPDYGRAYGALALAHLRPHLFHHWNAFQSDGQALYISGFYKHYGEALKHETSLVHVITAMARLNLRDIVTPLDNDLHGSSARLEAARAIALSPNDPEAHIAMAWALIVDGKPTEALTFVEAAMRLDPEHPSHYALFKAERLVGIHFFNPVAMMPLVEIVASKKTDDETIAQATAFTQHIGKLPLPVKSSPGFLVNRILMPYLVEALTLNDEGVAPEAIDKAATDFGMPMGPVQLADTVGLDICQSVARNLSEAYGIEVPAGLDRLVNSKHLGKKSGRGFYRYKKGKPVLDKDVDLGDQKMIQNRLVYRFLNEAAACLQEEIVADLDLLDAGIIFGTGFAPFRGGPMNYARSKGVESIVKSMGEYAGRYGERFKPSDGWSQIDDQAP